MTKSDLIAALAAKENLTEKQATDIINLILKGKNPRTGTNVDVRPKKRPFFRVGIGMKRIVDGK